MAELPSWPVLRARMLAPKPPLACTGYAIGKEPLKVRFDGVFTLIDGSALQGEAWLTSAIEPSRFAALPSAEGEVTGRETMSGRSAAVAEVTGLRGGKGVLRVWVDEELGCILRMERADDPAPLVVLDALSTA